MLRRTNFNFFSSVTNFPICVFFSGFFALRRGLLGERERGEGGRGREIIYLPSITQRNHVIDIYVTRRRPCRAIVWAKPRAGDRRARIVGDYVCAIALEHRLARVAGAGLSDPVGEQVARVASLRALGGDREAGELGSCIGFGGHVGWSAGGEVGWGGGGGGDGSGDCGDEEGGLHLVWNERWERKWLREE